MNIKWPVSEKKDSVKNNVYMWIIAPYLLEDPAQVRGAAEGHAPSELPAGR